MGLDIYLYRYDDLENTRERENIYHEFSEKLWADAGEYDSLTEEQYRVWEQARELFYDKLNHYKIDLDL
jgi:hypothetical protein